MLLVEAVVSTLAVLFLKKTKIVVEERYGEKLWKKPQTISNRRLN